jgi:uncharacterized protein (TIGR02271 family)
LGRREDRLVRIVHLTRAVVRARHNGDRLQVAVRKDAVKDAPHLDTEDGISAKQQSELLEHYGIGADAAGWGQHHQHADTGTAPTPADSADRGAAHRGSTSGTGAEINQTDLVRSEEHLNVDTTSAETGRARLRKYVVTERQTLTVPVTHEEVAVVREPISDPSAAGPAKIGDDAAEVTLHEDRVTVTKETVPVERVGLEVHQVQDEQTVSDTVRKERIETEGVEPQTSTRPRSDRE